MASPGPALSKD
jgi:hypothetical protein